ncbi:hypothetical protein [Nostoc sp. DSM 114159]
MNNPPLYKRDKSGVNTIGFLRRDKSPSLQAFWCVRYFRNLGNAIAPNKTDIVNKMEMPSFLRSLR